MLRRVAVFAFGVVSYATFLATFLYALAFVGGFLVPTTLDGAASLPFGVALAIDLGLLALFALQHSVMARPAFKRAWTRLVPEPMERPIYVLASSLCLIAMFAFWQPLGGTVWQLDSTLGKALAYAGFAFGWGLVLVATGGASPHAPFSWFRRRIVSVGSFAIATEPLDARLVAQTFPTRRNYVTSRIIGNYFRLTPDNRLIFGGRARFALSNPSSDLKGAHILESTMHRIFPALSGARIDHIWGGTVDLTADRLPRAGEHDGLHYAMGYSGHGVQMATHLGECMARVMGGDAAANPFADLAWPAIPGHLGKPWFLPMVGAWYKLQDRLH